MKTDTDQIIIPDPFGFFDGLDHNVEVADSFAKAIQHQKEVLAEETVQNLIDGGIIREEERYLKEWLLKYDLPSLTSWQIQSSVLKDMEIKRLGLEKKTDIEK